MDLEFIYKKAVESFRVRCWEMRIDADMDKLSSYKCYPSLQPTIDIINHCRAEYDKKKFGSRKISAIKNIISRSKKNWSPTIGIWKEGDFNAVTDMYCVVYFYGEYDSLVKTDIAPNFDMVVSGAKSNATFDLKNIPTVSELKKFMVEEGKDAIFDLYNGYYVDPVLLLDILNILGDVQSIMLPSSKSKPCVVEGSNGEFAILMPKRKVV